MNYEEQKLSPTFCASELEECLGCINSLTSFNLIGLPSVGVSFFIRFLSIHSNYTFIHINTYEMAEFTKDIFFEQFARKTNEELSDDSYLNQCRDGLERIATRSNRVVIIINRIDRLAKLLDHNFFDNLLYLRDASSEKIVLVFVSSTPLIELGHDAVRNSFSMHTRQVFFKPYCHKDLVAISQIDGTPIIKPKALELSGGHHALFQTLLRCQSLDNPLSDPMVELVIKDLYLSQNAKRREQLQALALGKKAADIDFLASIGLVTKEGESYRFFTELLQKYLAHHGSLTLPHKEKKLLKLLVKNSGRVVRKQDIFDYIWGDEIASDWALNSLVYRLRRHRAFDSVRYSIKSVKKDGYMLVDSSK